MKTVWAQQYDHETLQPVKARAYELPGLSASESADIVMLLMRIKKPSPEVSRGRRSRRRMVRPHEDHGQKGRDRFGARRVGRGPEDQKGPDSSR